MFQWRAMLVTCGGFGLLASTAWGQFAPRANPAPPPSKPVAPNYAPPAGPPPVQYAPPAAQPPVGVGPYAQQPSTVAPVPGAAQPPIATPVEQAIRQPFILTMAEEQILDGLLRQWEQHSGNVNTFSARFTLFEYDANWGPTNVPKRKCLGEIRYAKPDKGFYQVSDIQNAGPNGEFMPSKDPGEKWICDGNAVFEYNPTKKQMIEHRLPPELRGKAISDGPLPFVFGVEMAKLKARYWLRIITPPEHAAKSVWLEAYPKQRSDAANYQRIEIILNTQDLMPQAVQVFLPNNQPYKKVSNVYMFADIRRNAILGQLGNFLTVFVRPDVPFGWQHVIDDPMAAQGASLPNAPGSPPAVIRQ